MKKVFMAMIRFYQKYLSPLKRKPTCRFYPTCSQYALEAFEKRGVLAGFILTTYRLLRCQPLCAGGYDPVPKTGFERQNKPPRRFSFDARAYDPLPNEKTTAFAVYERISFT
ncbi:MAG: membrane protein insertion efficiency factor YidD [Clostridia bacterium]|nr:membrane protein insertion efficiency factor YidD [Clostridia bacterium]